MGRRGGLLVAGAIALALLVLGGCNSSEATSAVSPKVKPPVIKENGVLRVGVDLSYPPFAGTEKGERAGIDVDVASALAARLGLKVKLVDVKASQAATALAQDDVDVALSVPFTAETISRISITGTYLSDGPALFARETSGSTPTTASILGAENAKVGAQEGSEAYWLLLDDLGPEGVVAYPSLKQALRGLETGEVSAVGGDALVGAYIARDLSDVGFVEALGPAHLLGVAVSQSNKELSDAVRDQLNRLIAEGAIDSIRAAWVGPLPKLPLPSVADSDTAASEIATP